MRWSPVVASIVTAPHSGLRLRPSILALQVRYLETTLTLISAHYETKVQAMRLERGEEMGFSGHQPIRCTLSVEPLNVCI